MTSNLLRKGLISLTTLFLLICFTACAGVGTNGSSTTTLVGTISAVDATHHTVTLSANGQTYVINGLTDQEAQALQSQVGKTYTLEVTQNSDGSYTLTVGTNPTPGTSGSPEPTETANANETPDTNTSAENLSFTGPVQNNSSTSLTVRFLDGTNLTLTLNAQTDRTDLNGATISNGQSLKVEANVDGSGNLVATKLSPTDTTEANNTASITGTTTQALGSDRVLHLRVGKQNFSFTLASNADLSDFTNQAIPNNTLVKIDVTFTGTTGSITKVSNGSN